MSFVQNLPCASIILALLASVVSSALSERCAKVLTRAAMLFACVSSALVLVYGISTGTTTVYMMGHFPAPWGNEIRFGIIEPLMALVFSSVTLLSLVGGNGFMGSVGTKGRLYHIMACLVTATLLALSYTNDIFTGYVFIEICTVASCGLITARGTGRETMAAVRYMVMSLLGSSLFLLGVIVLYSVTGHLLFPSLRDSIAELGASGDYRVPIVVSAALITAGLGIKSGLYPFYYWMPDTYGASAPGSASVLSGVVSKGYIFLLIKIICCVFGTEAYYATGAQNILFVLGIAGMVLASLSAVRSCDIMRMTAFSSAAQMGYIFMGLGISAGAGIAAALVHIVFHALTKPAIFLTAGKLSEACGGRGDFISLTGAAKRAPFYAAMFTAAGLSMVGIPTLLGFVSKFLFAEAGIGAGWKMLPVLASLVISTVLNVMYFLRTSVTLYTRTGAPAGTNTRRDIACVLSVSALIAANFLLGIAFGPLVGAVRDGLSIF